MKTSILILFLLFLVLVAGPVLGQTAIPTPDPGADTWPTTELPPDASQAPADLGRKTAVVAKLDSAIALISRSGTVMNAPGIALARELGIPARGNRLQVQIVTNDLAAAGAAFVAAGGEISGRSSYGPRLEGWITPTALRALAAEPAVIAIQRPQTAEPVGVNAGNSETEGLAPINAPAWHAAGVLGAGVKIAVIDVGFTGYPALLGSDLPAQVITRNFVDDSVTSPVDNTSPHGTGVAEIIHDVAPQAQLHLIKINTDIDLEQAVNYAISQDIDIISTSLIWYNATPGDGSGRFADLVKLARDNDALWITAAGNDRQRHWGGSFTDADNDGRHDFDTAQEVNYFGPGNDAAYDIPAGTSIRAYLRWNDWTQVNQDLDLYLLRFNKASGQWETVGAAGTNPQTGVPGQRPVEQVFYTTSGESTPYGLVISGKSVSRAVDLELFAARMPRFDTFLTDRSLGNLADAPDAITVAAVSWTSSYAQKSFSAEGPTNGPGGSALGGLPKVDIAAYSGVATESYISSFEGTSAATPHVAGAAALVLSANPAFRPAEVEAFLFNAALDLGVGGYDTEFGFGRLFLGDAPAMPTPTAVATVTPTATLPASTPAPLPTATNTPSPFSSYLSVIRNAYPGP